MNETASNISGFQAIAKADAQILILGSIPGIASLKQNQYYAHPRNQFWPIICELLAINPTLSYAEKTRALLESKIALWDVVLHCQRIGSLDADINKKTIVGNDFPNFFKNHPLITDVFFNGRTAEETFKRHVIPILGVTSINFNLLPSTSPAHAALNYQEKLLHWRKITTKIS